MAAEPFTLSASVELPPDDGQPNSTLDFSFAGTFVQKTSHKLNITGAGTHVVGFGTIVSPGCKAIFLEYPNLASGLATLNLRLNGGVTDVEVAPGGCFFYCNPTPSAGITALSIVTTAAAMVRVTLLS